MTQSADRHNATIADVLLHHGLWPTRRELREQLAKDLDDALARLDKYCGEGKAVSIALCGNAAELLSEATANQADAEAIGRERGCRRTLWIAP